MRVAVVAEETAHHDETDAAVRLRRLAERLSDRRNDVTVFCARWWEDADEAETEVDGVTYRAVAEDLAVPERRMVTRLPPALRQFDPDVIHAAHAPAGAIHGAKLASVLGRTPLLVDWYDAVPATGWHEYSRRLAAHVPDLVITPSRTVQTAVRELGRPGDDTRVIPDAVDMDLIRETDPEDLADVVYARRLDGDANLESLLLALAELRELSWEAAVIGEGPERDRYEQQVRDLRIEDRVHFLDDQPEARRIAIFKGAHVAVHTALYAPFPADFLRALACGCVGIAEYHVDSSAHELIEQHPRGFRVTDEEELADAIREAADLEDREVDEDFERFDQDQILERYLDCYRDLGAL